MVRVIRYLCVVICVLSVAAYGVVTFYAGQKTDLDRPVITMSDPQVVISIHDDESAILQGITAQDKQDGDVTDMLIVESLGNFISRGVREATIAAFDKAGNVTKCSREVIYSDYIAPSVTLTGPLTVGLNQASKLLSRIKVTDCLDGDISSNVLLTLDSSRSESNQVINGSVAGSYAVRLEVSNSAGDTLVLPLTVEYSSTLGENGRPVIGLQDYLVYIQRGDSFDPLNYLDSLTIYGRSYHWEGKSNGFVLQSAEEQEVSIPASEIEVSGKVDVKNTGVYEITYSHTTDEGYAGSVRLVVVVEE